MNTEGFISANNRALLPSRQSRATSLCTREAFLRGVYTKKRSELTAFLGFIPINTVLFDCKCFAVGNVNVTGIDSPMGFEADRQSVGGNIRTALVKLLLYFESE